MKILDLFFAARPMLLLPVWSVYLVSLHYRNKATQGEFSGTDILVLVGLTLMFSGAYYLNEVTDRESDRINHKLGFLQEGFLTERGLMASYLMVSILGVGIAVYISLTALWIFLLLFVLGWAYSAPPFRLKDKPFAGLFANAFAYGFVVTISVRPDATFDSIGLSGWANPLYFFLTVAAIYCVTTVPDTEGDGATGKRTVAVVLGSRGALGAGLVLIVLSGIVAIRSGYGVLAYLSFYSTILLSVAFVFPLPRLILVTAKVPLLLLTILAGVFYPLYFVFIVALLVGTRIYYRRRFNRVYPEPA